MSPKFLTETDARIRVSDPVPCAICKEYTHNLDILWHAYLCSDECEAAYTAEYIKAEQQEQEEPK